MLRLLLMLFTLLMSVTSYSQVYVKGHYRSNGTYVEPHLRTYPDDILTNNYSYPGNYNPNKGVVTGGSTTYTSSKVDNYISYGSTDWDAIGKNDPKGFSSSTNYSCNKPHKSDNHNESKNSYISTSSPIRKYKLRLLYNQNGTIQYRICEWSDGVVYVFDARGNMVKTLTNHKL